MLVYSSNQLYSLLTRSVWIHFMNESGIIIYEGEISQFSGEIGLI